MIEKLKATLPVSSGNVYTTGQVARIAKVAPRTASKWFDRGEIKGYRLPGSNDRRVAQAELIAFLDAHGIGHKLNQTRPVVMIGFAPHEVALMITALDGVTVYATNGVFEAGVIIGEQNPRAILVDLSHPHARHIASVMLMRYADKGAKVIAVGGEDGTANVRDLTMDGFHEVLFRPMHYELIASHIVAETKGGA